MNAQYETKYIVSGIHILLFGVFALLGMLSVIRGKALTKAIVSNTLFYHSMQMIVPLIFGVVSYCLTLFVDAAYIEYIFGAFALFCGFLFGVFYQGNGCIFWRAHCRLRNRIFRYEMIKFVANIGAAIGNLFCGKLLQNDIDWFWLIISFCFALQLVTAIIVFIAHCLRVYKQWYLHVSMCEGREETSTGLLSPTAKSWSGKNKWTEDDVVGDFNISNLVTKYKKHHATGTVTNSLGLLDTEWVENVFEVQTSVETPLSPEPDSLSTDDESM